MLISGVQITGLNFYDENNDIPCNSRDSFLLQDEICKSIAESGGIDAVLQCIDDSAEQGNKTVARTCCSLLSKV